MDHHLHQLVFIGPLYIKQIQILTKSSHFTDKIN